MKKKLMFLILSLVLIYALGGIGYFYFNIPTEHKITNISKIDNYPYALKSNSTQLMKDEFKILKDNLENNKINNLEFANSIAKLFIIDLYTIGNKLNKYDVGGSAYIYPSSLDNYKLNVKDTLYKYVEDNENGKRKQKLPVVSSINIISSEKSKYEIDKKEYESFLIKLFFDYDEDLGYDKDAEITVIFDENLYYVVEKK